MPEHTITVLAPGTFSTIQDMGRPGLAHSGIPSGGAADLRSHVIGNRIVGNPDNAASVEMTLSGATVRFDAATVFVVVGAPAEALLGAPGETNQRIGCGRIQHAKPGDIVSIAAISSGARTYLCVAGGIDVPVVLGSRSTLTSASVGGHEGRALRVGDVLSLGAPTRRMVPRVAINSLTPTMLGFLDAPITVVECEVDGARYARGILEGSAWRVTPAFSRAGIRMTGGDSPNIIANAELTSRATIPGMIQQTPSGELIILGPDGPTTGGYAVVGCVARVDLPRIGQLRPGNEVRLQVVSGEHARSCSIQAMRELDTSIPRVE